MAEPNIEIDMRSENSQTEEPAATTSAQQKAYDSIPKQNKKSPESDSCCESCVKTCFCSGENCAWFLFWLAVSLMFLGLGAYYQIAVCDKYPDYVDVHCNTTSFRTVNVPFVGVDGYVAFQMLAAPHCQFPEQKQFSCPKSEIANCLANAEFNYNSGQPWACLLPEPISSNCADLSVPILEEPDRNYMSGCVKRTAFFITGGALFGVIMMFVFICWDDCHRPDRFINDD